MTNQNNAGQGDEALNRRAEPEKLLKVDELRRDLAGQSHRVHPVGERLAVGGRHHEMRPAVGGIPLAGLDESLPVGQSRACRTVARQQIAAQAAHLRHHRGHRSVLLPDRAHPRVDRGTGRHGLAATAARTVAHAHTLILAS